MGDYRAERAGIRDELGRLLAAAPFSWKKDVTPEERAAWVDWKESLIARMEALERREAELESEPFLWISAAQLGVSSDSVIEQSGTDSHVDVLSS